MDKYTTSIKVLPEWIEFALVENCNRTCDFCPKSNKDEYPNQNLSMSTHLYTKIINDLIFKRWDGTIMFCGYGEPLLYKNLIPIMKFTPFKMEIVTNGDLLTVKLLKELFSAGLTKLNISLYDGEFQVNKFKEMLSEADIAEEKYELRRRWFKFLTTNRAGTVENTSCINQSCYYPCYFTMIDWNGDVLLCPQDWRRRIKMGNISFESLATIWNSSNYTHYRKELLKGDRKFTPCKFCDCDGMKKGKNYVKEWEEYYKI